MPIKQDIFKRYLIINRKRWEIHAIRNTRALAEKIAESLRRRGYLARVEPYPLNIKFAVYVRQEKASRPKYKLPPPKTKAPVRWNRVGWPS